MGIELLFLLLPLAALSGWLIGRRDGREQESRELSQLSADYFKGLNFLLNEQPDQAIEVFIRMLEIDRDTVDTHFALASLFRRRGEVDRAIRIHQNLIARPTLSRWQRSQALFELGTDYMRAGLLDRAESLFLQLLGDDGLHRQQAIRQLLDIYQQEKDWSNAIAMGRRLQDVGGSSPEPVIAQFLCEQAEQALSEGERERALQLVRRALVADKNCVRATLLEGGIELAVGAYQAADQIYKRVERQDPAYLPEIIGPLEIAARNQGRIEELAEYLGGILVRHGGISIMLALADLKHELHGEHPAIDFVSQYLRSHPSVRGMGRLLDIKLTTAQGQARDEMVLLKDLIDELIEMKPIYRCSNCGYTGKALVWLCPSCKQWNTTKPIHGIEGE